MAERSQAAVLLLGLAHHRRVSSRAHANYAEGALGSARITLAGVETGHRLTAA